MRVLFASWHFYIDQSNGASVTTREILRALARRGWEVFTFCGSAVDDWRRADVKRSLARRGLTALRKVEQCDSVPFTTFSFRDEGINSILFSPEDRSQVPSKDVGTAFLRLLTSVLRRVKPDVVVTYGGYWLGGAMLKAAHDVGAKTVVLLQNFAYNDREYFRDADLVITPSQFSSNVYRERLGLKTVAIPPLIDWSNVVPDASDAASDSACRDRLLFVNPSRNKGVLLFARIAAELLRLRPDIPILVVEGSDGAKELRRILKGLADVDAVEFMRNTSRPANFFRHAKATLVPSFFDESFGRVAAESLIAGAPVVASTRGALPETLGDAAILLNIPERYTPVSSFVPTFEEARPWLDAIKRLWDDSSFYEEARQRGLERARLWEYSRVASEYDAAFRNVVENVQTSC